MVGFPNRWLIATIYLTGLKFVGLLEWIKSNQCGPLEADTFGRSTLTSQTEMAPPSPVVVPDVVIRPVIPVVRFDEFVFHK